MSAHLQNYPTLLYILSTYPRYKGRQPLLYPVLPPFGQNIYASSVSTYFFFTFNRKIPSTVLICNFSVSFRTISLITPSCCRSPSHDKPHLHIRILTIKHNYTMCCSFSFILHTIKADLTLLSAFILTGYADIYAV